MHHDGFVTDLAIVLGVAGITGLIFRLLRQPSILGYLFAGLLVGPYIPMPLFAEPKRIHALSEFGVVLVMFAVGLEFRLEKFFRVLPVSGLTGIIEISTLFIGGYFLGQWLGWTEIGSLFLGACLCISSTMAVTKIFEQRPVPNDVRTSIFGVLVLQDVAAIALIAVMTALSQGADADLGGVLLLLGRLLAVLVLIITLGMFVIPRGMRILAKTRSSETLVVGSMGLCFSLALLAKNLGYSTALGAFLAGILVAESGFGKKVEHSTASVRDVFAAVFFVSIGMTVNPTLVIKYLPTSLLVLASVISLQFVSVIFGGVLSGMGIRRSVAAGLALGQIGEFAFILAEIGRKAFVVGPMLQPILVTVAVLSTFTTALLLRYSQAITSGVDRLIPEHIQRLLNVYESWVERMRTRSSEKSSGIASVVRAVLFDLFLAALVIGAFRIWDAEIQTYLSRHLGLTRRGRWVSVLALGLALLPILFLLALAARRLARNLAARVFGAEETSASRFLRAVVFAALILGVGTFSAILLAPIVGAGYVWAGFWLAALFTLALVWRRAEAVDDDITSGGALLIQAIAEQGLPDADRETVLPHQQPHPLPLNLREIQLSEKDYAVGKTLTELRLRALTGASVLAVQIKGEVSSPTGVEVLSVGDVLHLAGGPVDQEAAVQLLTVGGLRTSKPPEE
jgi:CPA2 family monovalent cation:H+ antiporter-2